MRSDDLKKSVGTEVRNQEGDYLGEIIDILEDARATIEYAILKSGICFGDDDRFFAIPASSELIQITEQGSIVLPLNEEDLQFAKVIPAEKLPKLNLQFAQSIFELFDYSWPGRQEQN